MELLTVREAAKVLNVSQAVVRRQIAAGHLPSVKLGRVVGIPRDALERAGASEAAAPAATPRPLDGLRVLTVEQIIAGPFASLILAAFGADVIRIERPPNGDLYRNTPPYVENVHGRTGSGLLANALNKRSLALDLQQEEAREIFRRLAARSDVVLENNRPGVMDRLGLGYHALREINPRLVYVSISGFGQKWASDSPYADWPAFDIVAQAMGGLMMRAGKTGDPPIYPGLTLGDHYPGTMAVIGCLLALRWRDLTGEGQHVDISMLDATAVLLSTVFAQHSFDPELPLRRNVATAFPYGAFACADGYFVVAVAGDAIWQRFCKILDRPDLYANPTLRLGADRVKRAGFISEIIETWAAGKTALEASQACVAAGIPAA
ncbi:MAG TPA: CoA transferase, partial [Dehalococcoidia bacterium]|nr:CoA transferase [Dehalococcoidia bacterium]